MRQQEVRALGELAGEAIGGAAARIEEMHEGIAGRVWGSLGIAAAPVKLIHEGVSHAVYAAVSGALRSSARAGAEAVSLMRRPEAPSLEREPRGRIAIGALNGAFGDRLEESGSPLAIRMAVHHGGEPVEPTRSALRGAFPDATSRLAIFLHGLCETEEAWMLGAHELVPYGPRLRAELGYTPIYVRYNSGRHISDNGRDLAELLEALTAAWPLAPSELALIGHSMGGLVSRSACHQGAGMEWVTQVRHVFMLGCPHLGAPLERAANAASARLAMLPETKTMSSALNLRSAGVKDLRFGYLLEDDWRDYDPDAYGKRPATEIPFLRCANHYFVSASLSRDPDSIAGRLLGDLLVIGPSAWACGEKGKKLTFPVDHYRHVGGINHFQLLNHPAIYEQIRKWIAGRPMLPPGPTEAGAVADAELVG